MDYSTERSAKELAKQIEAYWHGRGYPEVKAWVVESEKYAWSGTGRGPRTGKVYGVQSNLTGREQ